MATVNEIFTKAKDHLRAIATDVMTISVKENKKVLDKMDENQSKKEKMMQDKDIDRKSHQNAVLSQIKGVEKAIKNQEVAETVSISNPEAITGDLKEGLQGIIEALQTELKNFDKNIVVKNDFSNFASLFKSSQDKRSVIEALKKIEDKIETPETVDYTMILNDIANATENKEAVDLLRSILEKDYYTKLPDVYPVDLDPNLIENDRVKTVLPDDQVAKMSQMMQDSSNSTEIIAAINDISDQQVATDLDGGGKVSVGTTAVEATFTDSTESIIITADIDNTGTLYVGKSDVATDGSNAIGYLIANESFVLDYDDVDNGIYVVASAASQNFWKGALL